MTGTTGPRSDCCLRRALRHGDGRAEISLVLINNTPQAQIFQLPQP